MSWRTAQGNSPRDTKVLRSKTPCLWAEPCEDRECTKCSVELSLEFLAEYVRSSRAASAADSSARVCVPEVAS